MREVSFGQDGDFSISGMKNRINADLANAYGNLAQRVLSFIYKQCEGVIHTSGALEPQDTAILNGLETALIEVRSAIDHQALHKMCDAIWHCIYDANAYVDAEKPWSLRKENPERMQVVLYVLCNVIKRLALLTFPILPQASETMLRLLGESNFNFENFSDLIPDKRTIQEPHPVFPRIVDEV
jgi:methionyl-tRNA synthetase